MCCSYMREVNVKKLERKRRGNCYKLLDIRSNKRHGFVVLPYFSGSVKGASRVAYKTTSKDFPISRRQEIRQHKELHVLKKTSVEARHNMLFQVPLRQNQ
uniref:Ovule protein n=1 Tax=Steinernema glaseri TaxID=37863 RepID=A0A1I7YQN3_9BILA